MELRGKTAIVLGGTSGIGLAATERLLEAGARVIAGSRSADHIAEARKRVGGAELVTIDVLDRTALSALFEAHAPFDVLVNAATGGARATGPFLQMDLDGFQGSFRKLWGYVNSVRLGAAHMSERGAIVLHAAEGVAGRRLGAIAREQHVAALVRAVAHLQQHVGVVVGGRVQAAPPVVLEAARERHAPRRGERRRVRVAAEELDRASLEAEAAVPLPVEPFAFARRQAVHHGGASPSTEAS